MKKLYFLLVLGLTLSLTSYTVSAQMADGSYAPDFSMMNYQGTTTYVLYDYLDAGKPVILDISAVWCTPCWNYHNTGALDDAYTTWGPTGTNELMVLWIEGDGGTLAQLQGGTGSVGDWTAGTTFPMLLTIAPNNATVVSDYEVGYFPTVYLICPDRTVSEVGQQTAANLKLACNTCPVLSTTLNDVKVFDISGPVTSSCSPDITPTITIQNYGNTTLTAATITSKIDGVVVGTYVWGGSLDRYEVANVTLPVMAGVADGAHTFTAEVSLPNGVADEGATNNAMSSSFAVFSTGANVQVKVVTDSYASEVSWKIFEQGTSTLVAGNDDVSSGTSNTYVCLDYACYTFTIYDDYGDGMSSPGKVLVTFAGDTLVYILGTAYTTSKSLDFCVTSIGMDEGAAITSLNVYPNPFTSAANIAVNLTAPQEVAINVYNLMGQVVYQVPSSTLAAGEHIYEFNGNNLSNGIYIVRMNVGNQVLTNRIELSR